MSPIPTPSTPPFAGFLHWSRRLNWCVERLCALLLGAMVLVVWLGILSRYCLTLNLTWTEELARYLMIWAALLAVSCGARYREHIGFDLLASRLPTLWHRHLSRLLDLIAIAFFTYLAYFGVQMTVSGAQQYATIFGMTMVLPFAAVPVSALLTVIQILASGLRCPVTQQALIELEMGQRPAGEEA